MNKIVIWGCGVRGKRILSRINKDTVSCFIDNDKKKIGTMYEGKRIIDIHEYIKRYSDQFILISVFDPRAIIKQIENLGIYRYFTLSDCPSEFQMPGKWDFFDGYLKRLVSKPENTIGIYGTTFFSIYLYELLKNEGNSRLILFPEYDSSELRLKELRNAGYPYCSDDKIMNEIDQMLVTVDLQCSKEVLSQQFNMDMGNLKVEDIFDNLKKIPEYRNKKLEKFRGRHQGKRCFIVATGPSLRMEDLETLRYNHEISIGMNKGYLAFRNTKWRPDYYVCGDSHGIEETELIIKNEIPCECLIGDSYPEFWRDAPEHIYKMHFHLASILGKGMKFSDDITYGVYCSETVTYACIQVAAYMGFAEIYLLGVDFKFASDYKDKSNHFTPDYYTEESQTNIFYEEESLKAYETAKRYADDHGIKIYNATRGGKLEVFERIDFDSLF